LTSLVSVRSTGQAIFIYGARKLEDEHTTDDYGKGYNITEIPRLTLLVRDRRDKDEQCYGEQDDREIGILVEAVQHGLNVLRADVIHERLLVC